LIAHDVSIYRITGDWHGGDFGHHFDVAAKLAPLIATAGIDARGSFPDLDMLNPYTNARDDPNFRAQVQVHRT
jgi:hypothetical protein